MLREVVFRAGLETVHATAEVNLIAIEGEDLFFGKGVLDLQREKNFLQLARGGALVGEEEIAGELHGQRGSTLGAAFGEQIVPCGAGKAQEIHAAMALKVAVFGGDDGLAQDRRKVVVVDDHAALQREGAEAAPVNVVEFRGGGGPVMLQLIDLGEIDGVDEHESGEAAGGRSEDDKNGKSQAPGDFWVVGRRLKVRVAPAKPARRYRVVVLVRWSD